MRKMLLIDGTVVGKIGKVVCVDVPRKLLFIEEMSDGALRLTYSKALIEDPPVRISVEEL